MVVRVMHNTLNAEALADRSAARRMLLCFLCILFRPLEVGNTTSSFVMRFWT